MSDEPAAAEPPADGLDRRHWATLFLTSVGVLMVVMDATIVNVALPIIREDLGFLEVSVAELQWVVNAYALAFAVLLLSAGKLADLFGRKRLFVIGLILFTGSSIACGAAGDINVLIGFRVLQGVGAALVMPTTLSILQTSIPLPKLGFAIGIWSAVVGLGTAIGPLAGGVLAEEVDWRWVFYVNAPIGVVVLIGTLVWIVESRSDIEDRRIDYVGALLSGASLFAITFSLLKGNDFGWADPRTLVPLAAGLVGLGAFVAYERRHPAPMLDLTLFRSTTFAGANIVAVFAGFALFGLLFFGSLFIQSIMGFSATETGLSQLPMMAMIILMAQPVARMMGKFGTGPLLTAGMATLGVSFLFFARLDFDSDFWDLLPAMIVGGIGFAAVLTPLTVTALQSVPFQQAGVGAAMINSTRQIGGSFGLAILGVISAEEISGSLLAGESSQEGFVDSFGYMMLAGTATSLAGSLVAYLMIVRPARAKKAAAAAAEAAAPPAPVEAPAAPPPVLVQHTNNWVVAGASVVGALPRSLAARAVARRAARVEVVSGPAAGERIAVGRESQVLGREGKGAGRLGGDAELSRRHARLLLEGHRLMVEDLGSTNGTRVNGEVITAPTALAVDDTVEVGATRLRVLDLPSAAPVLAVQVVEGPAAGERIPVGAAPLVFGRAEVGPGLLGNDPELSRRHASASILDDMRLLVEDLGSTNGTFVNEHLIAAPTVIGPGDRVRLGTTTFVVGAGNGAGEGTA